METHSRPKQQLVLGSVVNRVKARAPAPLYRCIRLGWHQLTGALDQFGFRRLAWRWRLPTEVGHWDTWLRTQGMSDPADFARRVTPDLPLQDHLKKLLPAPDGRPYRILDIGAGPLTTVGKACEGRSVDLVCIDPLAPVYDALLKRNGVTPLVRTEYGEAERVAEMYADSWFDLVHASNSLDHAHDPVAAIKAAVQVVRPGGYVYLEHILKEGERERYGGLHQWNFGVEGDSFTIASKAGQVTNISEALRGVADVKQSIHDGALTILVVHIQKFIPPRPNQT